MADDLGVVLCAGDDCAKHDLYSAFLEKYAEEDAFQENLARLLGSLAKLACDARDTEPVILLGTKSLRYNRPGAAVQFEGLRVGR